MMTHHISLNGCASTNFVQQKMCSWRPIFTPYRFLITDIIIFIFFLILALVAHFYNKQIKEASIRYDNLCNINENICNVTLHLDQTIKGQINFYYKLTNFHQNQRRYVISRSEDQLAGEYVKFNDMKDCKPLRGIDDNENNMILPCGLAAWTFFNDTYSFSNNPELKFSENNIAFKSDAKKLFKPLNSKYTSGNRYLENNSDFPGGQTNQHFIVWMRSAALPTLYKLYAVCDDCVMNSGDYLITIKNNYPTGGFKGEKWILVTKNSNFGTKNMFFGVACFVLALLAAIALVIMIIVILLSPRKRGDKDLITELIIKKMNS